MSADQTEPRKRTVTFGNFPLDTKADAIKSFINNILKDATDDLEEVFAFGKARAERGAARFKSIDKMWSFLKQRAGKNQYDFHGTTIYCNVDGPVDADSAAREKAVRKVVRAIIESNGGDGAAIKQEMEFSYKRGIVWWREERVAEWKDGHMKLKGAAEQYAEAFKTLMQ